MFNALYALVRSEHKRFQTLSEFVSANTRIAQVVCSCRWTPELRHSTLVATCPSLIWKRLLGQR